MPATASLSHLAALPADLPDDALVAVGVRSGHLADDAPGLDLALADLAGFEGKVGQTLIAATDAGSRLLVGVGDAVDPASLRKVGAAAARAARRQPSLVVDLVDLADAADRVEAAEVLAQGLLLGTYRFDEYKDAPEGTALAEVSLVAKGGKRVVDAVARGVAVAEAIAFARDLVNTPGGDLVPAEFARRVGKAAEGAGVECEAWDLKRIRKERLGGLIGVNRGSTHEPRLVVLRHVPEGRPKGRVALVGKGVTFDSGGLSIKPAASMEWMKTDMGGAAAVAAAMLLVPLLAPRMEVTAYLPLTDNMLGGDATRVGDVLRARNGKTIEVLNTDAEGRLILADALSLAAEAEPDAIVDLATLTGACMVALGDRTAGVMANRDALRDRVLDSAGAAGEAMWPLPLPDHLRKPLDSEVADLRNIGSGPYGRALTAGIFLREFVADVPWAHLDIAGPSSASAAWDEHTKGATGYGVRTLAALLAGWSKLPA